MADLLEQRQSTLCMKNYVRKAKFIQENAALETKIDNFQDKARKASFFDCGSIKVYLFVFALLLNEMRISRSRKTVSRGCVHLGGQVKALESPIKRIAPLFSMSSANFRPYPVLFSAFAEASLKSGMTLEHNRLSARKPIHKA